MAALAAAVDAVHLVAVVEGAFSLDYLCAYLSANNETAAVAEVVAAVPAPRGGRG